MRGWNEVLQRGEEKVISYQVVLFGVNIPSEFFSFVAFQETGENEGKDIAINGVSSELALSEDTFPSDPLDLANGGLSMSKTSKSYCFAPSIWPSAVAE